MKSINTPTRRHNIDASNSEVKIIINSHRGLGSILFFAVWVFMWTYMFSGLSNVLWSMILIATGRTDPNYRATPVLIMALGTFSIFFILLLLLGIFGIYRFLWELAGKEFITANNENIVVVRQLFAWKRTKEFLNGKIERITTRNTKQSLFWIPFQRRYRYAIELDCGGKTHRFGFLVKEQEAREIVSAVQAFILPE